MQQAELRMLLTDCARLWAAEGIRVEPEGDGVAVEQGKRRAVVRPAGRHDHPVRWVIALPDGRVRRVNSITAALTTVRNALRDHEQPVTDC